MARIRTIKPEFFTSDDVCALSPMARLVFIGTWCEADREGRLEWRPSTLKRKYLPDDDCDAEAICAELVERGLIVLYGQGLAYVTGFSKHQVINLREAQSKLPEPPAVTCNARALPAIAPGKGKEGKGKELPNGNLPAPARAARKSRIPDDMEATPERLEYAKAQGCPDPHDTFARFKSHHQAKGTLMLDWDKAWQNWCRNEKNFARSANGNGSKFAPRTAPPTVEHNRAEDWGWKLQWYRDKGMWNAAWGPAPGQPGCFAPKELCQ